jgi:hypothetical protein
MGESAVHNRNLLDLVFADFSDISVKSTFVWLFLIFIIIILWLSLSAYYMRLVQMKPIWGLFWPKE